MASSGSMNCVRLKPRQHIQDCMPNQTSKPAMSLCFFTPLKVNTETNENCEHHLLKSNKRHFHFIKIIKGPESIFRSL